MSDLNDSSTGNQTAVIVLFKELESLKYDLSTLVTQVDIERFFELIGPWYYRTREVEEAFSIVSSPPLVARVKVVLETFRQFTPEYIQELRNRATVEQATVFGEVRSVIVKMHCALTPLLMRTK